MLGDNILSEYVVPVEPVVDTMIDQIEPAFTDLSISYPVIAEPPLLDDAIHLRSIWEDDIVVAVSPVGEDGGVRTLVVIADAMLEGKLDPTKLIADTLYV